MSLPSILAGYTLTALSFAAIVALLIWRPAAPPDDAYAWRAECHRRCERNAAPTPTVAREYSRKRWPS